MNKYIQQQADWYAGNYPVAIGRLALAHGTKTRLNNGKRKTVDRRGEANCR